MKISTFFFIAVIKVTLHLIAAWVEGRDAVFKTNCQESKEKDKRERERYHVQPKVEEKQDKRLFFQVFSIFRGAVNYVVVSEYSQIVSCLDIVDGLS